MSNRFTQMSATVFFCSVGSVCSTWAIAAPGDSPAGSVSPVAPTTVPADLDKGVKVGSFGQIDLHVKDQDLTKILQLLSIQSQRNIIVNKGVSGTVTADLYSVDFYEAMDALLLANGLGYIEKGNFIYVYTQEDIKRIKDAERKTVMRLYRLNYLNAADANTFISPLLSSAGKIQVSGVANPGFVPTTSDGGANTFVHTDTIVITDYAENHEEIANLLKQMDIRPKQVLVEATVLGAKLSEANAFGVNLSILADFGFGELGSTIGTVFGATTPGFGGAGGSGTGVEWGNIIAKENSFRFGVLSENVAAFIEALDKVTDTTIIANPKLLVLNRQKANLLIGSKLGYVNTTTTESGTNQSVEFLDVGTTLSLRPFVSDDDMIRLEIQPKVSTGEVRIENNLTIPEEDTQELTTNVMVRSGQTVILGGLFKEQTTVARKQTPVLGDIPVLGNAFKGTSDDTTRDEYIFLITPSVVKDQAIYAAGERMKDNVELARVGAREGLLPWSRSRLISSHVKNASEALERGDTDKALYSANMALSLDPTFTEARRIAEGITNQRVFTPYDSVLEDTVREVLHNNTPAMEPMPTTPDQGNMTPAPGSAPTQGAAPMPAPAPEAAAQGTEPEVPAAANQTAAVDTTDAQTPSAEANVVNEQAEAVGEQPETMTEAQNPMELP